MKTTSCLLFQATNPSQYDDISWAEIESGLNSKNGTRNFFYDSFDASRWKNKRILDLGCGTGWLVNEMNRLGAKRAIGLDPSKRNIEMGKYLFPKAELYQQSIESFPVHESFDMITSVMVFNHVNNVDLVLQKLKLLLVDSGSLQIIIPSFDYFKSKKKKYDFEYVYLNDDEYVVKTYREEGMMCDVVRTLSWYIKKMESNDFKVQSIKSLLPKKNNVVFGAKRFKKTSLPIAYVIEVKK